MFPEFCLAPLAMEIKSNVPEFSSLQEAIFLKTSSYHPLIPGIDSLHIALLAGVQPGKLNIHGSSLSFDLSKAPFYCFILARLFYLALALLVPPYPWHGYTFLPLFLQEQQTIG